MTTTEVDNWPGDVEGLQGPDLMDAHARHAERFDTEIVFDHIHTRAAAAAGRSLLTGDSGAYTCDALIIATGASASTWACRPRRRSGHAACPAAPPATASSIQEARRGGDRRRQHRGGGSAVSVQHRRARDAGASPRQTSRREDPAGPSVRSGEGTARSPSRGISVLDEVLGDEAGVTGMRITQRQERCDRGRSPSTGVFIAIGHKPNTALFEGQLDMNQRLYPGQGRHRRRRHRHQHSRRVRRR